MALEQRTTCEWLTTPDDEDVPIASLRSLRSSYPSETKREHQHPCRLLSASASAPSSVCALCNLQSGASSSRPSLAAHLNLNLNAAVSFSHGSLVIADMPLYSTVRVHRALPPPNCTSLIRCIDLLSSWHSCLAGPMAVRLLLEHYVEQYSMSVRRAEQENMYS